MTTRRDRSSEVGLLASVHYAGLDFHARATVIRLSSGDLVVHSPQAIEDAHSDRSA